MSTLVSAPPTRTVRRAAGWGAIVAALFYLLQPLGVFVLVPEATDPDYVASPQTIPGTEWQGAYEVVTFGGIAIGTLVLVVAFARLRTAVGPGEPVRSGVLDRVTTALGIIGAGGWIGAAAISLALKSSVAIAVADAGADLVVQQTAFHMGYVVVTAMVGIAAFGAAGWAIAAGVPAAKHRSPGRAVGVVATVGGVLVLALALVTAQPMAGALVLIPLYLALGLMLVLGGRSAAAGAVG